MGIPLSDEQIAQFRVYLGELRRWNRVARLVSRDDPAEVIWRHFMDSLLPLPYLRRHDSLLDLGSGGGFPGLPLKIALPDLTLHLVESQRRKANFLRHVIRRLGLAHAVVHPCRMEALPLDATFGVVIARALAAPEVWLPWAAGRTAFGGEIVLMMGPSGGAESIGQGLSRLGLTVRTEVELRLPVLEHRRRIILLEQAGRFT
jgi:16S rRNA (guanine527-N7)-methyltransferase